MDLYVKLLNNINFGKFYDNRTAVFTGRFLQHVLILWLKSNHQTFFPGVELQLTSKVQVSLSSPPHVLAAQRARDDTASA